MARWALIAGPKRSDKTGVALELVDALRKVGVRPGGVVQVRRVGSEDRTAYDVRSLTTGLSAPIAIQPTHADADDEAFCSLAFKTDAFTSVREWLIEDAKTCSVLFLGDVSKLEVAGGGHAETIRWALALPESLVVLLCVRGDQLYYIMEKYELEEEPVASIELPTDGETRRSFVKEATAILSAQTDAPKGRE